MEFEQKAEEKKMSMSKNIARLAVTAGLTAALSFGGVMAPVSMAFAAEGDSSITINWVDEANKDNTFKAYQIFKAKVIDAQDGSGKIASDVKWAVGEQAQKDIIKAIRDSEGYSDSDSKLPAVNTETGKDPATPQNVADWLSANVQNKTTASANGNKGTRVAPGDVLYSIAQAVMKDEKSVGDSFKAGDSWTRPVAAGDGYYLFVSDDLTNEAKPNTGTSPIFAIVGGKPVTVTEKTSIPTVDKQILDDTADKTAATATKDDWKNVGDAWIGQVIDYKLTGTVAANIATYNKYQYVFQDHLSVGLDADLDSVVVTIGDVTIPRVYAGQLANGYTVDLKETKDKSGNSTGNDLTISFDNLKAAAEAKGVTLNENSEVVVKYKATLTDKAEYTTTGNTNDVKLVYSNNPMTSDTGTSTSKRVTDHVFRLDVTKVEKDNEGQKLEATFQVKMTKEGGKELKDNRWLTQTGGITDKEEKAGKFTTSKGTDKIYIPGLVAGTYEITECNTPAGYNTLAPFTITVDPTYDEDGILTGLDVTPSNTEMVTPSTTNDATIPVTIKNKKGSNLPLTGLNGVTFTWIAGGAVLCIGVAHLIRSRKQAEESEQE